MTKIIVIKILCPCRPETTDDKEEFIIDLVNDVWGMAGPDWRTPRA